MNAKNRVLLIFMSTVITGCAATNVGVGKKVFITPSDSAHLANCEMLGQVEIAVPEFAWKTGRKQAIEANNRLRDETAQKFPRADSVAQSKSDRGSGIAFKCFE